MILMRAEGKQQTALQGRTGQVGKLKEDRKQKAER
jgi:hypothetical protein